MGPTKTASREPFTRKGRAYIFLNFHKTIVKTETLSPEVTKSKTERPGQLTNELHLTGVGMRWWY